MPIANTISFYRTKGKTLEQMDTLFGDQLVPHALEDPDAAAAAMTSFQEKHNVIEQEEQVPETEAKA
jgi:hypothetical protein